MLFDGADGGNARQCRPARNTGGAPTADRSGSGTGTLWPAAPEGQRAQHQTAAAQPRRQAPLGCSCNAAGGDGREPELVQGTPRNAAETSTAF